MPTPIATARYETPLFSYAARMLGCLGDGERCLRRPLASGWHDLHGGAAPSRPQPTMALGLVRDGCFDELARGVRQPTGDHDIGGQDCVELAAEAALPSSAPPTATC